MSHGLRTSKGEVAESKTEYRAALLDVQYLRGEYLDPMKSEQAEHQENCQPLIQYESLHNERLPPGLVLPGLPPVRALPISSGLLDPIAANSPSSSADASQHESGISPMAKQGLVLIPPNSKEQK